MYLRIFYLGSPFDWNPSFLNSTFFWFCEVYLNKLLNFLIFFLFFIFFYRCRSLSFLRNPGFPIPGRSLCPVSCGFPGFARPAGHVWHPLLPAGSPALFQICPGNIPRSIQAQSMSQIHTKRWKTWKTSQKLYTKYRHTWTGKNSLQSFHIFQGLIWSINLRMALILIFEKIRIKSG